MGQMSLSTQSRVVNLWSQHFNLNHIKARLEVGIVVSVSRVYSRRSTRQQALLLTRPIRPTKKLLDLHYRFTGECMKNGEL